MNDDFEDNNPFAGSGRRFSASSSNADSDFASTEQADPATVVSHVQQAGDTDLEEQSLGHSYSPKSYSSKVEQVLDELPNTPIEIIDASKSHEGNSRGFIAYTIKLGDLTVRRRYSEFESFRNALTRLFPTLIVPPIPEKHSVSDYAVSPTKAKEDQSIIEHRQRRLAVFLNRCRAIPALNESPVFHRFLDSNASWAEVMHNPPISTIPKNILLAPPIHPESPSPNHAYLPIPSANVKLKQSGPEDVAFDEAEANAKEYETVISNGLEKTNRRITKRFIDMASDLSDLGAKFNAFSLEERSDLGAAIEKIGQAIDSTYMSTEGLISALSASFSEPLGESAQFAAVVRSVLKYRRQKALQYELTVDSLALKESSLASLEKAEQESQRINNYLSTEARPINSNDHQPVSTEQNENGVNPITSSSVQRKTTGFKFPGIGKLNDALHSVIDADPEATRRNNIGKTREQIAALKGALEVAKEDAQVASDSVRKDLERFQAIKEQDLRRMMSTYIKCQIDWAQKNLEVWQEAEAQAKRVQS